MKLYKIIIVGMLLFSSCCHTKYEPQDTDVFEDILCAEFFLSPSTVMHEGKLTTTIGIETLGGVFTPIIPSGTKVPYGITEEFNTSIDNPSEIHIYLLRGLSELASDNILIGSFDIQGISADPRSEPKVKINFTVYPSGIFMAAMDAYTGKSLVITPTQTLLSLDSQQ